MNSFQEQEYDLLVIGGGINGAAIANVAACQGLKTALVEKGDFASGTSSKSTKLIHGGLRYLEHFEFGLVREALRERYIQLKNVPHLVRPLKFVIPVYRGDRRPLWMMKLGVFLYDLLSGPYKVERPRSLNREEVIQHIPGINPDGLIGGVMYYDAQMDDARLCLENVLSAREHGADVANYVEVTGLLKSSGKVKGASVYDHFGDQHFDIHARRTVCAAGPWMNRMALLNNPRSHPRVRLTKGVHIVYRKKISDDALLIQARRDGRVFFVIPWRGHSLIGTTDTDFKGDPDDVEASDEDIEYLLTEARRLFGRGDFSADGIITTFAGLRPLIQGEGSPAEVSRRHTIEETFSGLVYVTGGKYTTYRKIAEECVRQLMGYRFRSRGEEYPLYGSGDCEESSWEEVRRYDIELSVVEHLRSIYGRRYRDVLEITRSAPELKNAICSCSLTIAAQVVYAVECEMARTVDDIIWRRLGLAYLDCPGGDCRRQIERYLKAG